MLNRNKADINSYVSNHDLEKHLSFLQADYPVIHMHSELPENIDDLFRGNNTHAVILLYDTRDIGHWVVLRKDSSDTYTYFDCEGRKMPTDIRDKFRKGTKVHWCSMRLMSPKENLCGKYCFAFVVAGNIPGPVFTKFLTSNSSFSPDQIIANMYRLNYAGLETENILGE